MTRFSAAVGVTAAVVLGMSALSPAGSDLPRGYGYRGPGNSGTYPATGLLRAWPEGGPKLLWKASPGLAACSVSVVAGKVYAVGGLNAELSVFTLDGQPLGRATLGSAAWKRFGFSRSTPLIAEGMAVGTTPNGNIYGVDLDTMVTRWKVNAWKDFGSGKGNQGWGLPESPVIHGSLVIFNCASRDDKSPPLVAVDIRDGYKVWEMDPGKGKAYSAADVSSALIRRGKRNMIVTPSYCYLTCLDADTGKVLWEIPSLGPKTFTPIQDGDLLLVSINRMQSDGNAPPTIRPGPPEISPFAKPDSKMTPREQMRDVRWGGEELAMLRLSEDGGSAKVLWVRRHGADNYSQAVMIRGRVYCYGNPKAAVDRSTDGSVPPVTDSSPRMPGSKLLCLDALTGELIAQAPRGGTLGHMVAAEGMVYATDMVSLPDPDGNSPPRQVPRIRLVRPTEKGFEVTGELRPFTYATVPMGGDVEWDACVPPVIAEGRLFFRFGPLLVYDIAAEPPANGWRGDGTGLARDATPPIRWGRQINVKWQADLPGDGRSAPAIGADRLYLADRGGTLACLEAETGKPLWKKPIGKGLAAGLAEPTPVAREKVVFAAAGDGTVACLADDGTQRWQTTVPTGESPASSPMLSEDVLVVQAGALHGLSAADGKPRWQVKVPPGKWGTPVKARIDGVNFVLTAWGALLKAADGQVLAEGIPPTGGLSPVVDGQTAYCGSSAAGQSKVVAIRLPERADQKSAVSAMWTAELKGLEIAAVPLSAGGLVYVLGRDGTLVVLDAADGKEASRQPLGGEAGEASLALAGGRVYAENVGGDHRTVLLRAGEKPAVEWTYATTAASVSAFRLDRQYVRAGSRVYAIVGKTPAEPKAVEIVDVQAPKADIAASVPVVPFTNDVMPAKWLFAGPIPERSLDKDFLADLGGREKLIPAPGTALAVESAKFSFAPLEPNAIVTERYAGSRPAIELTISHRKKWQSTGYYFTVIDNDKPRYVTLWLLPPGANPWKERLDAKVWLGGTLIAEKQILRMPAGRWPFMVQAAMGECEAWGKIFMLPRFVDVTPAAEQRIKDHAAAVSAWKVYQAEPKPFVLGEATR